MSRSAESVPGFRIHKSTGQGFVELGGRRLYLGDAKLPETRQKYYAKIAEWLANGRSVPVPPQSVSIAELCSAFLKHALLYYRHPDGTPTNEIRQVKDVLRVLNRLYGYLRAADFTPLSLQALQQEMIRMDWCRTHINRHINRIRHIIKWGVSKCMVPPSVFHGLLSVSGLKRGRSEAREAEPVKPVPEATVEATLPHLSRHLQAMVRLQLLTGMRPGEVCAMRGCDLDTTGQLWMYRPHQHKTLHHGHERIIYIGPQAKEVLRPFLKPDLQAHIFSPVDVIRERRQNLHAARKTPLSCGNVPGSNVRKRPRKVPTEYYTTNSYARAIARACEQAFDMPKEFKGVYADRPRPGDSRHVRAAKAKARREKAEKRSAWNDQHVWHPHQLRHTAAAATASYPKGITFVWRCRTLVAAWMARRWHGSSTPSSRPSSPAGGLAWPPCRALCVATRAACVSPANSAKAPVLKCFSPPARSRLRIIPANRLTWRGAGVERCWSWMTRRSCVIWPGR